MTLPASDRQELDTIIALELDRPAGLLAPVAPPASSQSLATGKKATASNVFRNMAEYAAKSLRRQQRDPLGHRFRHEVSLAGGGPRQAAGDWPVPDRTGLSRIATGAEIRHRVLAGRPMASLLSRREPRPHAGSRVPAGHRPAGASEHHRSHGWTDPLGVRVVSSEEMNRIRPLGTNGVSNRCCDISCAFLPKDHPCRDSSRIPLSLRTTVPDAFAAPYASHAENVSGTLRVPLQAAHGVCRIHRPSGRCDRWRARAASEGPINFFRLRFGRISASPRLPLPKREKEPIQRPKYLSHNGLWF